MMGDNTKPNGYPSNQYRKSYYRKSYRTIVDSGASKKIDKYGDHGEDDAVFLRSFSNKAHVPHEVTVEGKTSRSRRADSPISGEMAAESQGWPLRPGDDLERGIMQTKVITITNTPAP